MWKRVWSTLLTAALVLSLSVPALAAETPAPETPKEPAISLSREDAALMTATAAAQYGGASAVSYALWEEGEITVSGHTGSYSKTEKRDIGDDDLYGIGSVSKIYTTAAVMKLVEAGKIQLDSPVTRYLPEFKMADPRYKKITVRMLLNHSSGLMGTSMENAMLFADDDRSATEDLLERLSTQRLKADPGAYSVYCNDGFTLAELVVEAVSGKSFPEYLHSAILSPLGLKSTFTPQDDFDSARLVKTYLTPTDTRPLPQDCLGIVGTGGIYASASDLAVFGGALTGTKLLSQKSLDAMASPEYDKGIWPEDDADSIAFGLGWDSVKAYPFVQSEIQALAKGGDTLVYNGALVVIPEYHMAAAVLSSGGLSTYNQLAAAQLLAGALQERGVTVEQKAPALPQAAPAAMPVEQLKYAGYYGSNLQQMKLDIAKDGTLTVHSLTVPSTPAQVFHYSSDGFFRDETGTVLVNFVEESNGETYLYQKAVAQLPGLGILPVSSYQAQKMKENPVSSEVQAAWTDLLTQETVLVSEKYTSQVWPMLFTANQLPEVPEMVPGYSGAMRIVDATHAQSELQIPNNVGRDSQDLTVYTEKGVTYLDARHQVFMESAAIRPIYGGSGAYSTIQPDGYARWYQVGDKAGSTMSVSIPEDAGFYVYRADGTVAASSVLYDDHSVVLPEGGLIAFMGDPGDRFSLSFTTGTAAKG